MAADRLRSAVGGILAEESCAARNDLGSGGLRALKLVPGLGLIATSIRTLAPFRLYRPSTCEQVAHILQSEDGKPVLLAGGTDLCAQFNDGLAPRSLVALERIAALRTIHTVDGEIRIGSGVTHAAGRADPLLNRQIGSFAQAWGAIANARVRFRASIGGNIMAQRPRYEMSVILDALGASLSFRIGDRAVRLSPGDIWIGKLPARSFLDYVALTVDDGFIAFRYDRSLRPTMTLALCVRRTGDRIEPRAVIATEMLRPAALRFPAVSSHRDLRSKELASAAAATLPEDYADDNATNWYLRCAAACLLHRQLEDIARGLTT
jgi:carbon-monoxide dehydrogenase medium subunit